jgi:hypothetical protein
VLDSPSSNPTGRTAAGMPGPPLPRNLVGKEGQASSWEWEAEVNMPCARNLLALGISALVFLMAIPPLRAQELSGKVIDQTGVAVAGAKVALARSGAPAFTAVSDEAGRFRMDALPAGIYALRAEKPGYYATISHALEIQNPAAPLEIVLNHQQEFEETVNVVYSAPVIDLQEVSKAKTLTAEEIIDLPNVATHDFRNSLPLIPGIVKDNSGRMHLNGGAESQVYYSLDGFNIASPVSGVLESRVSVDAIRSLRVETSRYSAEYGKGSAGVMALETTQGDDHFRFTATNFIPSLTLSNGLRITNWNPRATVAGPIFKGRAWYFNALDLQYDLTLIRELPPDRNTGSSWQGSDQSRIQVNITNKNILTVGFLVNFREAERFGLGPQDPVETTRNLSDRSYFISLKDQASFSSGWVLETGFAFNQINTRIDPLGDELYTMSPAGHSGNYYLTARARMTRRQALASLLTPLWNWHGRHSLKFGLNVDRIGYRQLSDRGAIKILDADGRPARLIEFSGNPLFGQQNTEFSGFLQDSWTVNQQIFLEAGFRFDWDQILRRQLWSPRLAFTWGPARLPDTKFSAGVGIFYNVTDLRQLSHALDQQRYDTFYNAAGSPQVERQIGTSFVANAGSLQAPFYLNWSVGWQQKLIRGFYLDSNFIRKHGRRGWAYDLLLPAFPSRFVYRLGCDRLDSYAYLELGLSRTFRGKYHWLLSYARSSARTSEVIEFSQDNPVFSMQAAGPLNWDAPNRMISWAVFPVPKFQKYSVAYFAEWHSGLPWTQVNQYQQIVGAPNMRRFPEYFALNLHVERRIRFLHAEWALRVGFNNITAHQNPTLVNNNLDAADFGSYSGSPARAFTGRIRFLGKN